jgi:hypothetical protein
LKESFECTTGTSSSIMIDGNDNSASCADVAGSTPIDAR